MSQTILEVPIALTTITAQPQSPSLPPPSIYLLQPILHDDPPRLPPPPIATSHRRATILILTISLLTSLSSFSTGLLTISLPTIVKSIPLSPSLILWPQSIYALTSSIFLLPAGSIADVLTPRPVFLTGNLAVGLCG